jgi:hypothetical protein
VRCKVFDWWRITVWQSQNWRGGDQLWVLGQKTDTLDPVVASIPVRAAVYILAPAAGPLPAQLAACRPDRAEGCLRVRVVVYRPARRAVSPPARVAVYRPAHKAVSPPVRAEGYILAPAARCLQDLAGIPIEAIGLP